MLGHILILLSFGILAFAFDTYIIAQRAGKVLCSLSSEKSSASWLILVFFALFSSCHMTP